MKAIYLLDDKHYDWIYGEEERPHLSELLEYEITRETSAKLA